MWCMKTGVRFVGFQNAVIDMFIIPYNTEFYTVICYRYFHCIANLHVRIVVLVLHSQSYPLPSFYFSDIMDEAPWYSSIF